MPKGPLVAVLAAGRARRFGGGKLDVPLDAKPLGQWVLDAVANAGLRPGIIVVGTESPYFAAVAEDWRLVPNLHAEDGLATSIAVAAREAQGFGRALLLVLADMPLVSPAHLRRLAACEASAATAYPDGRVGVPVRIAPGDLAAFTGLTEGDGAGGIVAGLPGLQVISAPADSLLDVDDAAGLERVRRLV